jgi:hypothetical protein
MTGHAAGEETRPVIPSAGDLASPPHALGCIGTALACADDGKKGHRKALAGKMKPGQHRVEPRKTTGDGR